MQSYEAGSLFIKAIADPIRLQILDILSNGEMCACEILPNLPISQPTLSHHMKALSAAGWVIAQKRATWIYYSIEKNAVAQMHQYLMNLTAKKINGSQQLIGSSCGCCESEEKTKITSKTKKIGDKNHET